MNSKMVSAAVVAALTVAFLIGRYEGTTEIITRIEKAPADTVVTFHSDTVRIPVVTYRFMPAVLETVYVDHQQIQVASLDTITAEHDTIAVRYLFPPVNKFDLTFRQSPYFTSTRQIEITKTVIITSPWYIDALKISGGFALGYGLASKDLYVGGVGATLVTTSILIP